MTIDWAVEQIRHGRDPEDALRGVVGRMDYLERTLARSIHFADLHLRRERRSPYDGLPMLEAFAALQVGRRWLRAGGTYSMAAGSNTGFWITRWGGLSGVNLRIGSPFKRRCVTLLVHYQPDHTPAICQRQEAMQVARKTFFEASAEMRAALRELDEALLRSLGLMRLARRYSAWRRRRETMQVVYVGADELHRRIIRELFAPTEAELAFIRGELSGDERTAAPGETGDGQGTTGPEGGS